MNRVRESVWQRERERERERKLKRDREKERDREIQKDIGRGLVWILFDSFTTSI